MIVREFLVVEGRGRDFEQVFGLDGIWSRFLRQSEEYLGTKFRLESEAQCRYRVFDYWRSHWAFEAFRSKHQEDLKEFNRLALGEALVRREIFEGSFYQDDSGLGPEEGTDLVPL